MTGIGASQKEKVLCRLLYRICGSGFSWTRFSYRSKVFLLLVLSIFARFFLYFKARLRTFPTTQIIVVLWILSFCWLDFSHFPSNVFISCSYIVHSRTPLTMYKICFRRTGYWKGVQCYVISSESLIQEFSSPYGELVPSEVYRN